MRVECRQGKGVSAGAVLAAVLLLLADPAHALRCASRVITKGDHAIEVLEHCGYPTYQRTNVALGALQWSHGGGLWTGLQQEVLIEEWTYNLGPHRLMRVLRLENGVVTSIRHLGYGYTPR